MSLSIALPKGRLLTECLTLLQQAGLTIPDCELDHDRVLITDDVNWIIVRPYDVPVYVERGVADVGIVGSDVLAERQSDVAELVDLGIGKCRFVLAVPKDATTRMGRMRVATKFPSVTRRYLGSKGIDAEIITLRGAVELAPSIGLADAVVDLSASGKTLELNKLKIAATIAESTGRLIANPVALRLNGLRLRELIDQVKQVSGGDNR